MKEQIDKAVDYDPYSEERPYFRFVGYSGKPDYVSVNTMDKMSYLRESELDRLDVAHLMPGASIPKKYKEDPTKDDDEKSIKPSIWKRRRKVPKSYNYDFTALADRNVDKFRMGQKTTMEQVATNIFVGRHNDVFQ